MKTIPLALRTEMESGTVALAFGLKITRRDGEVFGVTSADKSETISGVRYLSTPGLNVASLVSTAGFDVDNTEVQILATGDVVTKADILAGRWDGAEFVLFRYNWANPSDGIDIVKRGRFGNLQPKRGVYVAEMRGLRQALQQPVGATLQPTCRYRLGSTAMPDGLCKKDLTTFTKTGTVDSVQSAYQFTDAARNEADTYFNEGLLTWGPGSANEGIQCKVRSSTAAGVIVLSLPLVFTIAVGDAYTIVAGCMKRLDEDCKTKFNNVLNFGGEPHVPGADALTAPASFST